MDPARRKAPLSAAEKQEKFEKRTARQEKAKEALTMSLSVAWGGQGWIPDDIRNRPAAPASSNLGITNAKILRPIWRITLRAVTKNISLPSLWQPGGILRESYSEFGDIWRTNLNQVVKDDSWYFGAPRVESNQSTQRTHQTNSADTVKASDQGKPRNACDTKDQSMEDGSIADFQETSTHSSSSDAPICLWDFIDGSSIDELEEQAQELKFEAEHATTRIMRTKELSDSIHAKIKAFWDAQPRVMSLLDNRSQGPETSTPDVEEHVKFLKDASKQRGLRLDRELIEILAEERDSNSDLCKIREKQKLVEHILNYKAAIERSDV